MTSHKARAATAIGRSSLCGRDGRARARAARTVRGARRARNALGLHTEGCAPVGEGLQQGTITSERRHHGARARRDVIQRASPLQCAAAGTCAVRLRTAKPSSAKRTAVGVRCTIAGQRQRDECRRNDGQRGRREARREDACSVELVMTRQYKKERPGPAPGAAPAGGVRAAHRCPARLRVTGSCGWGPAPMRGSYSGISHRVPFSALRSASRAHYRAKTRPRARI